MKIIKRSLHLAQAGFGLAEILVGLAIGLIATLVITQVVTSFEAQKRSSTGTADAQTSGSVGLYLIQRQVQMAGFGLPLFSQKNQVLNCAVEPVIDQDSNAATPAIGISPVVIVDGADGASDTIAVRLGNSGFAGVPLRIVGPIPGTPEGVTVVNNMSCPAGDVALMTDGVNCAMHRVVTGAAPTGSTTNIILDSADALLAANNTLSCIGRWNEVRYTVSGTDLMETVGGGASVAIASGVVSMQARYGITASGVNNQILPGSYVDATEPDWATAITPQNRNRIKAIRIALVVRNSVLEREDVSTACSSTTDPAPMGVCAWAGTPGNPAPTIDLSADPDWRRYRYRVFDTIIPVRNMIWSADRL